jgi:MoxR-like ATPase
MKRISGDFDPQLESVMQREQIIELQKLVRKTPVADHIFHYAAELVRATRPKDVDAPLFINNWLSYGACPRASLFLIVAGKARALLRGRFHVAIEDIQAVAKPVLRHRIIPNFAARSEGS